MITSVDGIADLMRQRPEWAPWLAVVGTALDEIAHPAWDATALRGHADPSCDAPVLANATLEIDRHAVRRSFDNVLRCAARSGTRTMAGLDAIADARPDPLAVVEAVINRDCRRLAQYALEAGAETSAFRAVCTLVAMPLLHACNRRSAPTLKASWVQGYCPVCGGWPAFAEVRGVERSRHFRCGDCGGEWQTSCLKCPFCDTSDHDRLASLVPETDGTRASVDVCNACLGYVKVFTTLRGARPADVVLHDLATVELDIAAAERGYTRTPREAYALDLKVTAHA